MTAKRLDTSLVRDLRRARRRATMSLAGSALLPGFYKTYRRTRAWNGEDRLSLMIRHAVRRVPFYRELFPATDPSDVSLNAFPVLRKKDLQDRFADLLARGEDDDLSSADLYIGRTSGSTGAPTSHLKADGEDGVGDSVVMDRFLGREGVPRHGDIYDLGLHRLGCPFLDIRMWPPRLYRWWNIPGFWTADLARESMSVVYAVPEPVVIYGLPSRLIDLARLCSEAGIARRPTVVWSTGEQLLASQRRQLVEAFGCRVSNVYNTVELGICGWECETGRIHFDPDIAIPEVLDEDDRPCGEGEVGRLVVTSLKSLVMPLIRYETGDLAQAASGCSCGRPSSVIGGLEGRQAVRIVTRDGRVFPAYRLLSYIDDVGLTEYQVRQTAPGTVVITVREGSSPPRESLERLKSRVSKWLDGDLGIEVEASGRFILTDTGKRNPVVALSANKQSE